MRVDPTSTPLSIEFRGHIPDRVKDYAVEKLSKLERYAPRPILYTKLEILHEGNPAIGTPFSAKASMDVNGGVLHATVSAKTPEAAIDILHDRLRRQIERVHDAKDSKPSHRGHEKPPPVPEPAEIELAHLDMVAPPDLPDLMPPPAMPA